jgi:hypothetical protein
MVAETLDCHDVNRISSGECYSVPGHTGHCHTNLNNRHESPWVSILQETIGLHINSMNECVVL